MDYHQAPGHPSIACTREAGGCAICDRIEVGGPRYREDYRRLFHPEEFPDEPPPAVASRPAPAPDPAPPAPAEGPSLFQKAVNLGKAVVDHVAAGMHAADDATVESRWATCRACEMFDAEKVVCRACGCHLEIKIRWAEQKCPIGKW